MTAIGIDLGTSTSEIAFLNEKGESQLIPNHLGEAITPSVVHIKEDRSVLVGLPAKELLLLEPEHTFMEIKRLLGTSTVLSARGRSYTPKELSSYIIRYLADCAENYLKESVEEVVITVPAYFTDLQRRETMEAGELAGLKVKRIINEPTAASLDYGINHMELCQNILVYDFGGGTLDVTVMELFEGAIDVKASCGNPLLGGKDFDQLLIEYIVNKINKKNSCDIKTDLRAMMRIKEAAETCKRELSKQEDFLIELPFLATVKNKPVQFSETITRSFFEALIHEKVYQTKEIINRALYDAKLDIEELDLILFVGGSTRIPLMETFFQETYQVTPGKLVDPDLAVAKGSAIQSGIILGNMEDMGKDIVIADVCPYSLSTEVLRDELFGETVCDILIPRNSTVPITVQKIYYTCADMQTVVNVSTYQGESQYPEENNLLHRFLLKGIPAARAGKEQVKITFSYDLNSILVVEAEVVSNGKKMNVEINTASSSMRTDLSGWDKAPQAKSYASVLKKAERIQKKLNGKLGEFDQDEVEESFVAFTAIELEKQIEELKRGILQDWDKEILDDMKARIIDILYKLEDVL